MSDLIKKDFLFFQNEILQDIKKVETKLSDKIESIYSYIQEMSISNEKRFNSLNSIVKNFSDNNINEAHQVILSQIENLKKKFDDKTTNNLSKINMIQKDLSNACYKYDKIVLENLKVPCLVGDGCPFKNLKFLLEHINKKIKDLTLAKDKTYIELNLMKEKMNNMNTQFKVEVESQKIKTIDTIIQKILENDEKCLERKKTIEEVIKDIKLENCKYSNDLINKADELKIQWEKLDNMKNEIYLKFDEEKKVFDEEKKQFKKYSENLLHTFNSQKEEFDIIKSRFIEVRDLIKNVRFKKNLKEIVNINGDINNDFIINNKEIKNLTKKLNFSKKQKISKKDMEILKKEENNLLKNQFINEKSKSFSKEKTNDFKKYINKTNIQNTKYQINKNNLNENNSGIKTNTFIKENKGKYEKLIDKNIKNGNNINYNINENQNINNDNKVSNLNYINNNENMNLNDNNDIINNDNKYEYNSFEENDDNESEEDEEDESDDERNIENNDYNNIIFNNKNYNLSEENNDKNELINDEREKKIDK